MKEVIRTMVTEAINSIIPPDRYATVVSADTNQRTAVVRYPGESVQFELPFGGVAPQANAIVRVSGRSGARFISDVIQGKDLEQATQITYDPATPRTEITRLRLSATEQAALASTLHAFQVGPTSGTNLIIDQDEIIARNNGAASPLYLQTTGSGQVYIGGTLSMGQTSGDRIYIYGADYKLGIESGTLRYDSNDVHRFMRLGAEAMRIDGNGILVDRAKGIRFTDTNHRITSVNAPGGMPWSDGPVISGFTGMAFYAAYTGDYRWGYRGTPGSASYFWVNDEMIIGSAPNDYINTHTLRVQGTMYVSSTIGTDGYVTANAGALFGNQVRITSSPNNSRWDLQQLRLESASGATTGLAMWVSAAGIAPVLRCFSGNGESIDCGNNPGTAYAQFGANNFVTWSSVRGKENIRRRAKEDRRESRRALKRIETVVYDDKVGEMKIAKSPRFSDVNKRWIASGRSPLKIKNIQRDTVTVEHDCEQNPCTGTATEPCGIVRRHLNRRGIVAEELLDVMPHAVSVNMFGETMGVDYGVITVELVDAVQDLDDENQELRSRIDDLEARLANLEAMISNL